jgi:hypothetical protein
MGNLIKIDKPEEGGDPFQLWQTICDIIDAVNDLSVTIVPGNLASVRIEEGDIQISFNPPPPSPIGGSDGGSQPTSGDTPGDVTGVSLGG